VSVRGRDVRTVRALVLPVRAATVAEPALTAAEAVAALPPGAVAGTAALALARVPGTPAGDGTGWRLVYEIPYTDAAGDPRTAEVDAVSGERVSDRAAGAFGLKIEVNGKKDGLDADEAALEGHLEAYLSFLSGVAWSLDGTEATLADDPSLPDGGTYRLFRIA
jgi:hypothetical protein